MRAVAFEVRCGTRWDGRNGLGLIRVSGGAGGIGEREQDAAEESDSAHQALP